MIQKRFDKEILENAVKKNYSIAGVLKALGIVPAGGNYKTVYKYIDFWNIDVSHFTGQLWNKGKHVTCNPPKPLKEILVKHSQYQSYKLAKRLLKEGLKELKCERCKSTSWLGENIPLELHHINGDNMDNRIENLQLLCPNCHALTDNYRGKNIKIKSPEQ